MVGLCNKSLVKTDKKVEYHRFSKDITNTLKIYLFLLKWLIVLILFSVKRALISNEQTRYVSEHLTFMNSLN